MPGRSLRDEMQGVAPVRSYGAPLGAQVAVNAPDRPKVGAAPPATQHSALEQAGLFRKPIGSSASPSVPVKPPTAPSAARPATSLSVGMGAPAQGIRQFPGKLDQAIEEQGK